MWANKLWDLWAAASTLVTSSTPTHRGPKNHPAPLSLRASPRPPLLPCASPNLVLHFRLYYGLTPNRLFPHLSAQTLLVKVNDSLHVAKNRGQFSGLVVLSPQHLT